MEEWFCARCDDLFFGNPPECGLCIACQDETSEYPCYQGAEKDRPS
jgi:hypothetical protein